MILSILALPIALPLAFALIAVAVAVFVVLLVVIISLFAVLGTLVFISTSLLFQPLTAWIVLTAAAGLLLGLGCIFLVLSFMRWIVNSIVNAITNQSSRSVAR